MKNRFDETFCDFCGVIMSKQEVHDGGYDRIQYNTHCCIECYGKIVSLIKEGQVDYLCESRMKKKRDE